MIDIDFFKRVNDAYGHQVGDAVLRSVTDRIRVLLRAGDVVGRWGGEEFLVLLADADRDGAAEVAERIRMSIARSPLDAGNGYGVPVTVSIGVAVDPAPGVSELNELVGAADAALYRAKAEGRNRVVAA
jgi:diguanylate cyclase (GGDEF)-like protein